MKNAAIICVLSLALVMTDVSAQTRLALKSWTKGVAKTATPFPILTISKDSKWTLNIRSREERI